MKVSATTIDIATLKPAAPAELVGTVWIAETYGLTQGGVYQAIKDGRLPTTSVPGSRGYFIRPEDAWKVWGQRYVMRRIAALAGFENET